MDASSFRLVTAAVLPGCCFCTTLEVVTSGEASEAGVKLESLLSSFLWCSARLEPVSEEGSLEAQAVAQAHEVRV